MIAKDFISPQEVLSDVTMIVNDRDFKKGIPQGYYLSQIQKAMEEMALSSFFHEETKDFPIDPIKLQCNKPENSFNIREIYLLQGDCCKPTSTQIVHYKRLYNNGMGGTEYTAKRKENTNSDPFFKPYYDANPGVPSNVYWASEKETHIQLSANCANYQWIRFVFNGFNVAVGDVPVIPRDFRTAITDYVKVKILEILKNRDLSYRTLWADAKLDLEGDGLRRRGSWKKACDRVKMMSTWKREEYREYFSKGNW